MVEYRQQEVDPEETVRKPDAAEPPAFMTLAAQYGIAAEMDISSDDFDQPTVEQEYQAYLRSPSTPKNLNLVKYWEVITNWQIKLH